MGKSENNISPPPEGKPRPSLFSAGAPAADHNILDAMASRASPAPSRQPRRLIWLLAPLLAATGWVIATQLQQTPAAHPVVQTAAFATAPATPAPVAPVAVPTAAASGDAAAPANPFNTLERPGAPGAQASTPSSTQAPATFDMQAALDAPAAQTEAAPQARAKAAAETKKPAVPGPAATPKTQVAKAKAPSPTRTAAKTTATSSKKSGGSDPDVELLSAIMKHLGDDNGSVAARPRSAQTIAELVKSCKGKDAIEGLLCQRRICEGSWGKAQACPMNLAPKQTAKVTAVQRNN